MDHLKLTSIEQKSISPLNLAIFMTLYQGLGILAVLLIVTVPLKQIFKRARPVRNKNVYRILNMRDLEHNYSMPSGDTLAAAYFTSVYFYVFGAHWTIFVCVCLAALGRVYVHCHWLGDTLVGGVLGLIVSHFVLANPYFVILSKPLL